MAKQYSRPAYPDIDVDFSSMGDGFDDIMNKLAEALDKSVGIPSVILDSLPEPKPEPIDSRFEILDL
jgi:hypothetical protein